MVVINTVFKLQHKHVLSKSDHHLLKENCAAQDKSSAPADLAKDVLHTYTHAHTQAYAYTWRHWKIT